MNKPPIRSIIFFALPGIGDALMMMPTMKVIKEAMPEIKLTVLTMIKPVYEIYQYYDDIDELLYYDFLSQSKIEAFWFICSLRKRKFDISVMGFPSNRAEYSLISFLVGAKNKLGHKYLLKNLSSLNWLYDEVVQKNPERHNVEENFELVKLFLPKNYSKEKPEYLFFPEKGISQKFADDYFQKKVIDVNKIIIGIHAGSSTLKNQVKKRWPPEYFKLFVQKLTDLGIQVIIFSGLKELYLQEFIKGESSALMFNDKSICNTASVIRKIPYFVSNDSGIMHLATALGCEVISIFGPTNKKYTYPYSKRYKVVSLGLKCSPCFEYSKLPLKCDVYGDFRCITKITVKKIIDAVYEVLS